MITMINEESQQELETFLAAYETLSQDSLVKPPEDEIIEVRYYPEDQGDDDIDQEGEEIAAMAQKIRAEHQKITKEQSQQIQPIGYVSNARNATSRSDMFQFWAPAEETSLGIGSIVRHTATIPQQVDTYGIIVDTIGSTLGLDDYAVHVYEQDALPPLNS